MTAASVSRVTALTRRRSPRGFDAIVYRLGLSLAGWAHHRAQHRVPDRAEQLLALAEYRARAERERDAERIYAIRAY